MLLNHAFIHKLVLSLLIFPLYLCIIRPFKHFYTQMLNPIIRTLSYLTLYPNCTVTTQRTKWLSHRQPFFAFIYSIELTQLFINIAIVIGPTPPGTGVIALVCGATLSKSTSPHNLLFSSL